VVVARIGGGARRAGAREFDGRAYETRVRMMAARGCALNSRAGQWRYGLDSVWTACVNGPGTSEPVRSSALNARCVSDAAIVLQRAKLHRCGPGASACAGLVPRAGRPDWPSVWGCFVSGLSL
jgi:hypothetical protein